MVAKSVEELIDTFDADPGLFARFKEEARKGKAAARKWVSDKGFESPKGVAAALATLTHDQIKAMKAGREAATAEGVNRTFKAQMV
jgi:hypothetical protein